MATGARGEGRLELNGETYVILFTSGALMDFEKRTGRSAIQVSSGNLGMVDVHALLVVGLDWARRDGIAQAGANTNQDASRLIDQLGVIPCLEVVMECLRDVLTYGKGTQSPPA